MNQKSLLVGLNACLMIANLVVAGYAMLTFPHLTQTQAVQAEELRGGIPVFDPNFVVSDETFRSTRAFPTAESVQATLNRFNSPLKSYSEGGKSAAAWIFGAARGTTSEKYGIVPDLNPGLLIAYLEKEQSLLTMSTYNIQTDTDKRMQNAMGYGCPDGAKCNPEYSGFANQVNYAAYQLEYNFRLANTTNSANPYQTNKTISTLDNYNILLTNAATAAQYRYTPHVYWGNYNLWKIITAYGWGRSETTYDMGQIDSINLPGKRVPNADNTPTDVVTLEQIKSVLSRAIADGEQSKEVENLQKFLRQQSFFNYPYITGYFGSVTKAALEAYRTANTAPAPVIITPQSVPDRCQTLKNQSWSIGQESNQVRELQDCMAKAGVFSYSGGSTGYFGPISQAALARWKGEIISTPVPPAPSNTCSVLESRTWNIGQSGDDVRALQQCLKDEGKYNYSGGITGYFGSYTRSLLTSTPQTSSSSSCPNLKQQAQSWQIGQASDSVRALQQCLKDEGRYKWGAGITGYFGPYTKSLLS